MTIYRENRKWSFPPGVSDPPGEGNDRGGHYRNDRVVIPPPALCPCCRDAAERRRLETLALSARLKAARDAEREDRR
jgi:hypothetical protein